MALAKKMRGARRQVTRGGDSFTEVKRDGKTFHVRGQGADRKSVEVKPGLAGKLASTPVRMIQNQGTAAPERKGQSATQSITPGGRIQNQYVKDGRVSSGSPKVVLNEQQTLAEISKLPAQAQAEVRRRMRIFKRQRSKSTAASTGGTQAPSA